MKYIEKEIRKCKKCGTRTTHSRNASKTGLGMALLHLVLIIATTGLYLIPLCIYLILKPTCRWSCDSCYVNTQSTQM